MKYFFNFFTSLILTLLCQMVFANTEGIKIYQKNLHLSPEKKQLLAQDIKTYHEADNLWDALRQDFSLPHYEDNPMVQGQIVWFLNHQDFLRKTAIRAAPYLYYIAQQIKLRHLPAELALLPMMESGFNPFAYSSAGAAGLWQMMPSTATDLGIKQNWWYDGRRDVIASTKAALNYLAYLNNFFNGNWLLATAAYDTGEGNVVSAINKNIRSGYRTDFWVLPVAQETRDYVPRLLALAIIIAHPDQYPLDLPYVRNAPYLAQIDIGDQIDLKHAAYLAGMSLSKLMQLNPGYNHTATDPNGPFKLVLPIENVEKFSENLAMLSNFQKVQWTRYKVKAGDQVPQIAQRFNTTTAELKKMNPLLAKNMKAGGNIIIPHVSISKSILSATKLRTEEELANISLPYTLQSGDTLYMVRNGDDIAKIAKHFQVAVETIAAINKLTNKQVQPGDKLMIPTHLYHQENLPGTHSISPGDTIYIVRAGDSLDSIAEKFHSLPAAIRVANLMTETQLHPGDNIVIPTHLTL